MRVFVLADDLTGANATASLLKRQGLPSHTHLFADFAGGSAAEALRQDGVHVLDLDTRDRGDNETTARVAAATHHAAEGDLLGLRVDSTLRGPVTASLNTLLGDPRRFALMVPAFPASGRTVREGIHYVHGVPLAETEVAHDPVCPVTSSCVAEWIGARLRFASASVGLDAVRAGEQEVTNALTRHMASRSRIVFCDAETDHDVETIARAAVAIRQRGCDLSLIPVDPGPFTAAMLRVMREPAQLSPWVFGIVGSVMQTSRQQMDFVEAGGYAFILRYHGEPAAALLAAFEQAPRTTRAMLLRTDTAALDTASRSRLYDNLEDLLQRVVARFPGIGGYLLSGGETAGRLLSAMGAHSLRLQGEIQPLVTLSRIVDGRLRGRLLVTKGGTVGNTAVLADALGRLYDALVDDGAMAQHNEGPAQ